MEVRRECLDDDEWVVKTASSADEAARLRHEARQLRRAAHPGVVEVGALADEGMVELRTRHAGCSLRESGSIPAAELCGLGAAVATVLADLHDLGIVHGAVDADHILIGPDGRPVLCGFGSSASTDERDARVDGRDLALTLADRLGPDAPRRLTRVLLGGGRRPAGSTRALAAALREAMPDSRLPSPRAPDGDGRVDQQLPPPSAPTGEATSDQRRAVGPDRGIGEAVPSARRRLHPRATTRGLVGAGSRTVGRLRQGPRGRHVTMAILSLGVVALAVTAVIGLRPYEASKRAACPPADRGCRPIPVQEGTFVTSTGTYAMAIPRPVVVLGRWECGRSSLPAALDPRTGQVWAWLAWAGPTKAVVATAVTTRSGATTLRVVPGASGCDRLQVIGGDGTITARLPGSRSHA